MLSVQASLRQRSHLCCLNAFFNIMLSGLALRVCHEVPWNTGEADMRCFEASMIFLTASSFRFPGHCHFLFGQTLGIPSDAFNPLSVEPGERYGVSKEKEDNFPFSRTNQAKPDVAFFQTLGIPSHAFHCQSSPASATVFRRKRSNFWKKCKFLVGSFSALSKRNFARKYAFDSIFQDIEDAHTSAPLQTQHLEKIG